MGNATIAGSALPEIPAPEQAAAFEGHADTPGAKLWYWDTGGPGDAIILCHPASQSSQIWLYQQPVFAKAGYRVIAYSRRGVYRSERGPDGEPGTTTSDLLNLFDRLGIERAHVLGAAAGGITALGFGVAHPKRVRSLVLAGTIFSPAEQEWRDMYARLGLAAVRPVVSTEFLELGPTYRATCPQGVARFAALEHEAKVNGVFAQPTGAAVTWPALAQTRVPTLLLTGEADLYAPPPLQNLIAKYLPVRELATLREVGHAPYWEAPDAFNKLVLDFLARQ
jgi:pimeloyl-ACP methyl ester carboxylesterase